MFMMNRNIKILFILLFSVSFVTAQVTQKDTTIEKKIVQQTNPLVELREQLDDYFGDQSFSNALWGVMVKSLRTGEILYKRNADKLFIPASNMKLFTSAAALLLLGSNYTFNTELLANGEFLRGTLKGDLIVIGSGDPTISNRFYNGNLTKVFEMWADTLKAKGIFEITGDILGDDSAFDNNSFGKGWPLDYESSWFASPSGALSFNDNIIDIIIEPTDTNYPAKVTISPDTKFVSVIPKIITTDEESISKVNVSRLRGKNLINVKGNIKKGSAPIVEHVSISDPTLYFVTVLKEVLEKNGIVVRGRAIPMNNADKTIDDDNLIPIYAHQSVPLKRIVREMNKVSNNFYAEQLIKTIGLEEAEFGSIENGVKACKELFSTMGINLDNMVMADGSGLSRLNLITPRQIVNLLTFMHRNEDFYESLPIAGVDGTLIDRMKKSVSENNVHAKPGYNDNITALSGYLKTISGEPIVFSLLLNNFLTSPSIAYYIQDNVCHRLINFNRN